MVTLRPFYYIKGKSRQHFYFLYYVLVKSGPREKRKIIASNIIEKNQIIKINKGRKKKPQREIFEKLVKSKEFLQ